MYNSFFQLEDTPFNLVPDPARVLLTPQHADAISGMLFGVMERKGYIVLTGEAGLGKTTVVRSFLHLLSESGVRSSVVFNPILTPQEFLEMALLNFGLTQIPSAKSKRLKLLEDFLVKGDAEGRISVLIVDEAHQIPSELLEEIRLLGNFDGSRHKLLQIVLVGQSELAARLDLPELWQLKQRITIRLSLERLEREAVEDYIAFRWDRAGGKTAHPFAAAAMDGIAEWSNGIPRLINAICENSLIIAFSEGSHTVDLPMVREACFELKLPTPQIRHVSAGSKRPDTPVERPPEPESPAPTGEIPQETNNWAASMPSVVKRWLRLETSQPARTDANKMSIIPLQDQES